MKTLVALACGDAVQQLIQSRERELTAAIRADAEARVDQLKAELTNQVARSVTSQLNWLPVSVRSP